MNKSSTSPAYSATINNPQPDSLNILPVFPGRLNRSLNNRFLNLIDRMTTENDTAVQMIYPEEKNKNYSKRFLDSDTFINELLRFSSSSLISFLVDIGLFSLTFRLLPTSSYPVALLLATGFARLISSIINFTINKNFVFMNSESTPSQLIKYYLLCMVQMLFSWLILYGLSSLVNINLVVIKISTDVFLFISSFTIQRFFIFRRTIHIEK